MAKAAAPAAIPFVGDITKFLEDEAPKGVRDAIRKADKEKTASRLVAVEPERWQASPTDRKRFAGGFFREQRPSGNLGGRLYAETKTGILYVQDRFGKSWEKIV